MQNHMSDAYIYYQENLKEEFPIYYVYWSQSIRDKRDLHYHNCAELGLCLKGSGIFFIDNQIYPFQRNTISYIEKGHPHILPILELAQQSGFHSLSSFNRFFLKRHGISPRQFRNNYEKPDSCKVSGPDKL